MMNNSKNNPAPTQTYSQDTFIEHYILFGIPCSGKGEHSKIIKSNLTNFQTIEMGQHFRDEIKYQTKLGRAVEKDVWAGNLLDDKFATEIINRYSLEHNTIFDGYFRTPGQEREYFEKARTLCRKFDFKILPMVISIDTDEEVAVERMNIRIKKALENNIPVRQDDVEKVLRHRIQLAQTITAKALHNFKLFHGNVLHVDGNAPILGKENSENLAKRVTEINNFIKECRGRVYNG